MSSDHYVTFDDTGWVIEHSVACRQSGTTGTCVYNAAIGEIADEPALDQFGRWRITNIDSEGLPSLERVSGSEMYVTEATVQDIVAAARRGAISLAADPTMRHYSPDILALVYQRTVENLAGAGDLHKVAERMATDPALEGAPIHVVEDIMAASFKHFAGAHRPERAADRRD